MTKLNSTTLCCLFMACACTSVSLSVIAAPALSACVDETVDIKGRLANCTAIIESHEVKGRDLAAAFRERAIINFLNLKIDASLADFDEAIKIDPRYADAFSDRGAALVMKGDIDRAIADFKTAIRLDSRNLSAFTYLGHVYQDKHELDAALENYSQAMALGAGSDGVKADLRASRAEVYVAKANLKEAATDYDEAIRIDPKHILATCGRAGVVDQQGDHRRAMSEYNACLALHANDQPDRDAQSKARKALTALILKGP